MRGQWSRSDEELNSGGFGPLHAIKLINRRRPAMELGSHSEDAAGLISVHPDPTQEDSLSLATSHQRLRRPNNADAPSDFSPELGFAPATSVARPANFFPWISPGSSAVEDPKTEVFDCNLALVVSLLIVDTGHDNSGVSGPVLIPMRFVWPYGGRRVFLSGTFTRWTDHIPMSPMEGLPSVFQVIYSVSPGYHQFKFFVDGEWRHDERQPFETGNYGVVNTVYLATENDEIPGCNMEVDNDTFLRLESVPRISEADINISRHRISVFLSTHTAYELLPESGKVVALDVNLPVKQAFHILYEQGIPVAPLWDFCKAQFVGVLSALDFILILKEDSASPKPTLQEQSRVDYPSANLALPLKNKRIIKDATIVFTQPCKRRWDPIGEDREHDVDVLKTNSSQLGNHGSNLTEEELETHSISAWKEGKLHLNRQIESSCRTYPRSLIQSKNGPDTKYGYYTENHKLYLCTGVDMAGPYDTLKDVASKILQNKVATVPVIHSSSQDASFPQLLHLASLSGILKCICRHFRHSSGSLPILQQPICSLSLGSWVPKIGESNGQPFAMLRPNASLSAALSLLVEADVSSIPIVDDNDSLLDIYCRSDITALAKDRAYAQIRLEEMSINQALQLGQDVSSPFGFFSGQRCQMCLRSDSLHKVMERLANPGVRRLVIVEAGSKRVEGIVSLRDVFNDAYHDLDVLEIYSSAVIDGPVNGLFCVFNCEDRFIIWNPAIREFRTLPFPGRPELPPNLDIVYSNTGFGFDKSNDDYKVVLIRCSDYRVKDMPMVNDVCVHVYSLSTNTWRRLDGLGYPSPEYLRRCRSEIGAYSDGVYYWWAGGGVVAFDMGNEVFRAISAPFVLLPSEVDECVVRPCNGDGRIALYRFKGFPESAGVLDRSCDIWVMEEEEGSWIKRFSVGPITCGAFQQGFWKNGELLFLRLIQGSHDRYRRRVFQLVLYNPYTRELRYLGPKGDFSDYRALVYHESLVSVNGGMHQTKGRLCDSLTAAQYLFSWPPRIPRFDL
ncbi:hypothetical protein RHSIM_Rhsim07G0186000 [Rhododendron simsii]|uniref:CBS domain-containing protein n=1 Tax=Rhododendron simsii TaxID=118357 RepID=A0A834GMQ2_RHOSS|nr:hypothetical protein RHSIM_Rhsim07G0186000 [Rhododendron simsii]